MGDAAAPPVDETAGGFSISDFGGTEAEFAEINRLDELMCVELELPGKPKLPSYGMGWFEQRCKPDRKSYRSVPPSRRRQTRSPQGQGTRMSRAANARMHLLGAAAVCGGSSTSFHRTLSD